jgi:hypothetical protein
MGQGEIWVWSQNGSILFVVYRTAWSSGAVGTFCLKLFPKRGTRERERESLLSILAASCSHPEVSGLRQFRMDLWHPAAPRKTRYRTMLILHVTMFNSVKFERNCFHCFLAWLILIVFPQGRSCGNDPPNDRQWGLVAFSVRLLCRLYSFCSRAAFANLRRCETDPRRSSPNPKG